MSKVRKVVFGIGLVLLITTIITTSVLSQQIDTAKEQRERLLQERINKTVSDLTNFSKDHILTGKEMEKFVKEVTSIQSLYKDSIKVYGKDLNITLERYNKLVGIKDLYTAPKWRWGAQQKEVIKREVANITGYDVLRVEESFSVFHNVTGLIIVLLLAALMVVSLWGVIMNTGEALLISYIFFMVFLVLEIASIIILLTGLG